MNWLNTELFGMHVLFWLFSVLIAVILFLLTVIWLAIGTSCRKAVRALSPLSQAIGELPGQSLDHVESVRPDGSSFQTDFSQAFAAMEKASADSYRSQWFPDPARYLSRTAFGSTTQGSQSATGQPDHGHQAAWLLTPCCCKARFRRKRDDPNRPDSASRSGRWPVFFSCLAAPKNFRTLTNHLNQLHLVLADHLPVSMIRGWLF